MSDLQISLLAIGALVIVCVLVYNNVQQRRLQRKLNESFGDPRADVLIDERPRVAGLAGGQGETDGRIEPLLDSAVAGGGASTGRVADAPEPPASIANIDETIDCVATLSSGTPLTASQVSEVLSGVAEIGRAHV